MSNFDKLTHYHTCMDWWVFKPINIPEKTSTKKLPKITKKKNNHKKINIKEDPHFTWWWLCIIRTCQRWDLHVEDTAITIWTTHKLWLLESLVGNRDIYSWTRHQETKTQFGCYHLCLCKAPPLSLLFSIFSNGFSWFCRQMVLALAQNCGW